MIRSAIITLISVFSFAEGYIRFIVFSKTPVSAHKSMRRLFHITNGRSNDWISLILSKLNALNRSTLKETAGVLGDLDPDDLHKIVVDIEKNGFHLFDRKLPANIVNELLIFAEKVPCEVLQESSGDRLEFNYSTERKPYREAGESVKYNIRAYDILVSKLVQDLVVDPSILAVAASYLKCNPILDLVAMWWSRPSEKPSSEAAQLYHFDMDRIKFLKFFFYLTDVTPENGPHCYVRGSCKRKPKALCRDGRILDHDIKQQYAKADLVEICGGKGTIVAVDTRGFHKGKPLQNGERLILQFEFANSMFGANYPLLDISDFDADFRRTVESNKKLFGLIKY